MCVRERMSECVCVCVCVCCEGADLVKDIQFGHDPSLLLLRGVQCYHLHRHYHL